MDRHRHRFDADPDPTFRFDADPNTSFKQVGKSEFILAFFVYISASLHCLSFFSALQVSKLSIFWTVY